MDRAAAFLADVLDGPVALDRLLDAYVAADGSLATLRRRTAALGGPPGRPPRIRIVGLGSSRFAGLTVAAWLRGAGVDAAAELASAGSPTPAAPGLVVFAVSASGTTREVVDAVKRHRGTSLVVAVTNRPDSAIAAAADLVLPLLAGEERAGVACRTYAATLAVLALAASVVTDEPVPDLRPAIAAGASLRAGRSGWAAAADVLDGADEIHVIGDGGRPGTLEQAALVLREAPRLAALPVDAGDWLHTAVYTMLPRGRALLFTGTPYDAEVVATIRGRGGEFVSVGPPVASSAVHVALPAATPRDAIGRSIVEIGAAELIAAELWSRARALEA